MEWKCVLCVWRWAIGKMHCYSSISHRNIHPRSQIKICRVVNIKICFSTRTSHFIFQIILSVAHQHVPIICMLDIAVHNRALRSTGAAPTAGPFFLFLASLTHHRITHKVFFEKFEHGVKEVEEIRYPPTAGLLPRRCRWRHLFEAITQAINTI